jgi:hypothetical protein
VSVDVSAVRAVERSPKDAVERYLAIHALMALPGFRKCDVDGPFVDGVLDCMEEIEVSAGRGSEIERSWARSLVVRNRSVARDSPKIEVV